MCNCSSISTHARFLFRGKGLGTFLAYLSFEPFTVKLIRNNFFHWCINVILTSFQIFFSCFCIFFPRSFHMMAVYKKNVPDSEDDSCVRNEIWSMNTNRSIKVGTNFKISNIFCVSLLFYVYFFFSASADCRGRWAISKWTLNI